MTAEELAAFAAELAKSVPANTILDGELVVLDGDGRSQFEPLLRRRAQPERSIRSCACIA
jgi:ATP-dependent DNA ligase